MRKTMVAGLGLALLLVMAAAGTGRAEGPAAAAPVGAVVAVAGAVQVGTNGQWQAVAAKQQLFEGQLLRTGEQSSVEILFGADTPARLGEKAEIAVADLLLKATLEKAKAKIAAPEDGKQAEMQVTPVTGVRGTEKTEEKAGDLKREHYWNESAAPAK